MLSHESEALTFIGAWQNDKKYDRTEILHIAKTQPKQAWPTTTLPKLSRTLARSWPTPNAFFFTPFCHLLSPVLDGSSVQSCFFLRLAPFAFSLYPKVSAVMYLYWPLMSPIVHHPFCWFWDRISPFVLIS